jgi:ferredoxin
VSKSQNRSILKLIDSFGDEQSLPAVAGASILEIAVENSVEIHHSCGGMGSCGTCRIRLTSEMGAIPVRSEIESEMAQDRGFDADERLSCQIVLPEYEIQWKAEALDREL